MQSKIISSKYKDKKIIYKELILKKASINNIKILYAKLKKLKKIAKINKLKLKMLKIILKLKRKFLQIKRKDSKISIKYHLISNYTNVHSKHRNNTYTP
jgi:hypothetical protein